MNSRVAILTTMCLLFALAWRGDGRRERDEIRVAARRSIPSHLLAAARTGLPASETTAERSPIAPPTDVATRPEVERAESPAPIVPVRNARPHRDRADDESTRVSIASVARVARDVTPLPGDVPLPVDIAPGEYRVVSSRGDVFAVTLAPHDLVAQGLETDVSSRPDYVRESSGVTWHFIRVEPHVSSTGPAEASLGPARPLAPIWTEATVDAVQRVGRDVGERIARVPSAAAATLRGLKDRFVNSSWNTVQRVRSALLPTDETMRTR